MASYSLNKKEILEKLFSPDNDESDLNEPANFVPEIDMAQHAIRLCSGKQWMTMKTSHTWMTQKSPTTACYLPYSHVALIFHKKLVLFQGILSLLTLVSLKCTV